MWRWVAWRATAPAGRMLKGAKPDELSVVFPRKWDLVLNLKAAATALRLTIAPG